MELSRSAARVAAELSRRGIDGEVRELPQSTRSAAEAARAVGCEVAQIAKSLVFHAPETDRPILVIASGAHRVDEQRLAEVLGERVEQASAEFVRACTGFAVGGVPPVGHDQTVRTFLDERLTAHERIWAAAGTPKAVFPTTPEELRLVAAADVVAVTS